MSSVNKEIVEFVITGKMTKDSVEEMKNKVYEIARSMKAKKMLIDIRGAEGRLGYTDTYILVTNVPSFFYDANTVFVDLPENAHLQKFHEHVAKITGIPMKWFTDPDDARAWLNSR
jgi:5-bromo-4-chloroindolyl phosphate hydrolysis protein